MPTIAKPVLKITVASGSSNATINLKGKLTLRDSEKAAIAAGAEGRLILELWAKDDNPNPDDKLMVMKNVSVTDSVPINHTVTVSKSAINEDGSVFDGGPGDEIYAKVVFKVLPVFGSSWTTWYKNSDVIHGKY